MTTECLHANTIKTITREAVHEHCEDCGADRTTFAIQPTMKEGETLMFRARDFKAAGDVSLLELVEIAKPG